MVFLVGVGSNTMNLSNGNDVGSVSVDSDDACSKLVISPNLTHYWVPNCDDSYKPHVGQCFSSFETAFHFYEEYGRRCGFDVRRSTRKKSNKGDVLLRYYICHREGFGDVKSKISDDIDDDENSKKGRKMMFSRCGCNANLRLRLLGKDGNGVCVYKFVEKHNHKLVDPEGRHFLKSGREMSLGQKSFAFDASKVKIGASQAHELMKELVGGYENVGATVRDFRNWSRDLKQGIGQKDAQIILDKFKMKKEKHDSFYYAHDVDSSGHLTKLFWADPIGRRNYEVFGDVVSFDATFGTNK